MIAPLGSTCLGGAFAFPATSLTLPAKIPDSRQEDHSAFAGTDLQAWLTEHGITRVVVCGIRTEQCCETTSRHASDLGYAVDYVTDATLTFPMTHPRTGRTYSPAEIKERTELVLEGRFATIVRAAEAAAR